MFGKKKDIIVNLKFYSGIDKSLNLENYSLGKGIDVIVSSGTSLKKVLKDLGINRFTDYVYFRNSERIGHKSRLADGDSISCLRPSGGG